MISQSFSGENRVVGDEIVERRGQFEPARIDPAREDPAKRQCAVELQERRIELRVVCVDEAEVDLAFVA